MGRLIKNLRLYKQKNYRRRRFMKFVSMFLVFNMFLEMVLPLRLLAITSGPSQPEAQGFQPIGANDMVDPFSGDFSYNIPLMDIDGYPINISYSSSGVSMDSESSWVGLGWSLNVGSVVRNMRGLPDDFSGDVVKNEISMKDNVTHGAFLGFSSELFGLNKLLGISMSISGGMKYNNYNGYAIENSIGANLGINASEGSKGLTGNLGLNIKTNSQEGMSFSPSASFGYKTKEQDLAHTSLSSNVGASFNSRSGLQNISYGASMVHKERLEKGGEKFKDYSKGVGGSYDFGLPTYTPKINYPMETKSVTASFTLGGEIFGLHPGGFVRYFYSRQKLASNSIENPAYGYMNSDYGQSNNSALHDFNREKEGSISLNAIVLPIPVYTNDVYSVSGQGVGGSYRPFRSDVGYVFDAEGKTSSVSWDLGGEAGFGNLSRGGVDINNVTVVSKSGRWEEENNIANNMKFRTSTSNPKYEKWYFKEANEKSVESDPQFRDRLMKDNAVRVVIDANRTHNKITDDLTELTVSGNVHRSERDRRNMVITHLNRKELDAGMGLQRSVELNLYVNPELPIAPGSSQQIGIRDHHIAEMTSLNTDGTRYVYGIAAYNTRQEETTFSINKPSSVGKDGLVGYISDGPNPDNSTKNKRGQDNYFSNTIMPPYAHSYLLTAVLSPDYVDSDGLKGPSDGDIGNYTKFSYTKISNYKWRTPFEENTASYNEGLKTKADDDKANYIYGEKELWYLDKIETKNFIAVFQTSPREDGYGVKGKNGGRGNVSSKKLDKISLYAKRDYLSNPSAAVPIKEVNFVYNYSLCPGIPNSENNGGKLTLEKIYFTYGNSRKAYFSPYQFHYNENPNYAPKDVDRWGVYKPQLDEVGFGTYDSIPNCEYPYSEQDKGKADKNAKAWLMSKIELPSGGVIRVDYESDDYAYVQNVPAKQMYKIRNVETEKTTLMGKPKKYKFTIDLEKDKNGEYVIDKNKYYHVGENIYFRFLMKMRGAYDYVSGYAEIDEFEIVTSGNVKKGLFTFKTIKLNDDSSDEDGFCPSIRAACQFARLNLSKEIQENEDEDNLNKLNGEPNGIDYIYAISRILDPFNFVAKFGGGIREFILGPNRVVFSLGVGQEIIKNKSWIRLNNVNGQKLGGGSRVKSVMVDDSWHTMTLEDGHGMSYGQSYTYRLPDGSSSGVASFEPQLGGDENSLRHPKIIPSEKPFLGAKDVHYVETPIGESFFPSPQVGYSRVVIKNVYQKINGTNEADYEPIEENRSGYVEHEFYTAKDYPTFSRYTTIDPKPQSDKKNLIKNLLKINYKDYNTMSQGFLFELNDMHGKPKSQRVYQEGSTTPISSVEYKYQSRVSNTSYGGKIYPGNKLDNRVKTINKSGIVSDKEIGVFMDVVSDMRHERTDVYAGGLNFNLDGFLAGLIPVLVPIPLPSYTHESTQFRSVVLTKVIQRFGILEETIARDLGSIVSTKTLAYDAETGEALVSKTKTNFDDDIYSMTYPAYWHYDEMGGAYQNIGTSFSNVSIESGVMNVQNAHHYFVEGDELMVSGANAVKKGWVISVWNEGIYIVDFNGEPITSIPSNVKIIRSGRKNQQSLPMASLTSYSSPLQSIVSNNYDKVVQASAIEYSNRWRTFCECFEEQGAAPNKNPYTTGVKGMYKPNKSFLHLSGRTQTNKNNNTNVRTDGVFTSFNPYYKNVGGRWVVDSRNWTFTSEVTQFSPFGSELENKDALGRFSAASFGYNQSLATAVGANMRYKEMGADNFEDYHLEGCADKHFKFDALEAISMEYSHTGRYSIKVSSMNSVTMAKTLVNECNCNMSVSVWDRGSHLVVMVNNGTSPYVINYQTDHQDVSIGNSYKGTGLNIELIPEETYDVDIVFEDRYGCLLEKKISIVNGEYQQ